MEKKIIIAMTQAHLAVTNRVYRGAAYVRIGCETDCMRVHAKRN